MAEVVREHQIEGIIHTAAVIGQTGGADESRTGCSASMSTGTLNVLEAARAANARVTYVSTATLYGQHADLHPLTEEHLPRPGRHVRHHQADGRDARHQLPQDLRDGHHGGAAQDTSTAIATRPAGTSWTGCSPARPSTSQTGADLPIDVTYVKDLALGLRLALTVRPIQHRIFNITGGVSRGAARWRISRGNWCPAPRSIGPGLPRACPLARAERPGSRPCRARLRAALHARSRDGGLADLPQASASARTA